MRHQLGCSPLKLVGKLQDGKLLGEDLKVMGRKIPARLICSSIPLLLTLCASADLIQPECDKL